VCLRNGTESGARPKQEASGWNPIGAPIPPDPPAPIIRPARLHPRAGFSLEGAGVALRASPWLPQTVGRLCDALMPGRRVAQRGCSSAPSTRHRGSRHGLSTGASPSPTGGGLRLIHRLLRTPALNQKRAGGRGNRLHRQPLLEVPPDPRRAFRSPRGTRATLLLTSALSSAIPQAYVGWLLCSS
jgi:hypothetical protein